jgi:hypothetical protein
MFVLFNKCLTNKKEIMQEQVDKILTENGLDFHIDKVPLVIPTEFANVHKETPYYGLVNSKTGQCIHAVKKGYVPSQNREVVEMVLKGIDQVKGQQLSVHKAGSIQGGKRIFIQLALEGEAHVGDDTLKKYITIIDSNDGSTGLSVGIGDITMSCMNQFFYFYKNGNRFRHSASLSEKLRGIPSEIETALAESFRMIERYQTLARTPLTAKLADQLVKHLLGVDRLASAQDIAELSTRKKNQMDMLHEMIEIETTQKGDTLWGLHSGVTRYTTHGKSTPKRDNGFIESQMIGGNAKMNLKSLDFVLEHA